MTPLRLASMLAAALGGGVLAQSDSGSDAAKSNPTVWAAVSFINSGELTPVLGLSPVILTPQGAQQMVRQGSAFRQRYLTPASSGSGSASDAPSNTPIQGMPQNYTDAVYLRVLSQSYAWVSSSALAFLQGLYPPNEDGLDENLGGKALTEDLVTNTTTNYPLDGYQYPAIKTLSLDDSSSISLDGAANCQSWQAQLTGELRADKDLSARASASQDFYNNLFNTGPLRGFLPAEVTSFWYAQGINDLVNFLYRHNETVHKGLENADKTLKTLHDDALTMASASTQATSSNSNDTDSVIRTIAGRTFAQGVAAQFEDSVSHPSHDAKLVLMFGSSNTLTSFYSIAGLLTRDSDQGPMGNLTAPGALISFELIGDGPAAGQRPDPEDLMIRFVYRPTADEDAQFQVLPLFGSGFDGNTIPYTAFIREMKSRGRDAVDWCELCNTTDTTTWCSPPSSSSQNNSSQMAPAVAGVIGAIIMGGMIAAVWLGLFFLGGYGIRRRNSAGDGLKGAEKRPSDRDVQFGSGGDPQERIGSWEMRDGQAAKTSRGDGDGISVVESQRNPFDDDAASEIGAAPVKVRESF